MRECKGPTTRERRDRSRIDSACINGRARCVGIAIVSLRVGLAPTLDGATALGALRLDAARPSFGSTGAEELGVAGGLVL